jgi:hypothetical protein
MTKDELFIDVGNGTHWAMYITARGVYGVHCDGNAWQMWPPFADRRDFANCRACIEAMEQIAPLSNWSLREYLTEAEAGVPSGEALHP